MLLSYVLKKQTVTGMMPMQAGEVGSGQGTTNRANTIKVSREKGFVVYMACLLYTSPSPRD